MQSKNNNNLLIRAAVKVISISFESNIVNKSPNPLL